MEKTDLELFKEALNEAWDNKIRREVESCTEEIITSERHKAAMQAILDGTYDKKSVWKFTKAKVAAILVAAALLLASCAVIYRNEIRDFVEEIYDKYIEVIYFNEDNRGKTIEKIYELTYVPDGYVLEDTIITPALVRYEYIDSHNNKLIYEQKSLSANFAFNNENGYKLLITCGDVDIYYKAADEYHFYLWNDGEYSFIISTNDQLSNEDIDQMINNIVAK